MDNVKTAEIDKNTDENAKNAENTENLEPNNKKTSSLVPFIIIVSVAFSIVVLAAMFNFYYFAHLVMLAGFIVWLSAIKYVMGASNFIVSMFALFVAFGAISMAMVAFVPFPINGVLAIAVMAVAVGTIMTLFRRHYGNGSGYFGGGGGDGGGGDGGGGGCGGGDGGGC